MIKKCEYCEKYFEDYEVWDVCEECRDRVCRCSECGQYFPDDEFDIEYDICIWCREGSDFDPLANEDIPTEEKDIPYPNQIELC